MRILLILFFTAFGFSGFTQNEAHYNRVFDSVSKYNQQKEGIAYFESELKKFPKNEWILRSLGALNFQLDRFKETRIFYNKALEVNPECAKCYFYLAQVLVNEDHFDGAYQALEKGIAINAKEGSLYSLRGRLKIYQGNEISGLNDLSKAISVEPDNADYYLERATYFMNKENYLSAKRDLLKAVELDPKNLTVYNYLAQVYSYERDFPNALKSINKALELAPNHAESLLTRGEVYFMNEEYGAAIENYGLVTQLQPGNYEAHHYLANAYYELERMDDFCTSISRSIQLMEEQKINDPEYYRFAVNKRKDICDSSASSYYYQRGIAAFNLGDFTKSLTWYNKGIEKFPDKYMAYSFRANVELALGENRKAIADHKISLSHPEDIVKEVSQGSGWYSGISNDSLDLFMRSFKTSAYISYSFCHFNLGETDSALRCIDSAIRYTVGNGGSEFGDAFMMKGILLLDKGMFYEAEIAFKEIAKHLPEWSLCQDYIALALICQANKNSVLSRNKIEMKSLRNITDLQWYLPNKLLKGTSYAESALNHIQKALKMDSNDSFAYYLRAHINRQMRMDYCSDFLKANQLGYPVELVYLKECR